MPEIKFKVFKRRGTGGSYKWYGQIDLPLGVVPGTERVMASRTATKRVLPTGALTRSHRAGQPVVTLPVTAPGKDKASALANAATLASKVADNPLLQAVMPPGTSNALAAAKAIGKYGPTALNMFSGSGAKRVGSFLKSLF